jgi:hypothetical protein
MYRIFSSFVAAQILFFRQNFLEEIFANPPCAPGTCAAVPGNWLNVCEFNYFSTFSIS